MRFVLTDSSDHAVIAPESIQYIKRTFSVTIKTPILKFSCVNVFLCIEEHLKNKLT